MSAIEGSPLAGVLFDGAKGFIEIRAQRNRPRVSRRVSEDDELGVFAEVPAGLGVWPVPPNIVARSGCGLHGHWLLRETIDLPHPTKPHRTGTEAIPAPSFRRSPLCRECPVAAVTHRSQSPGAEEGAQ